MNGAKYRGILAKPDALSEEHVPSRLEGREEQAQQIRDCLAPALRKRKPFHVWLHGPPGCGKSAVARAVLRRLEETGLRSVYVNGLQRRTFYAVIDRVLDELRVLAGDEKDTTWKLEVLARIAVKEPLVLAVDEVDGIPTPERDALIYNLASLGLVGLVLISQSRGPAEQLDGRVLSRLNPHFVEFAPYPEHYVLNILKVRAEEALHPETWALATLEKVARLAMGDARFAIQTLRAAAYRAEHEVSPVIEDRHVDAGVGAVEVRDLKRVYLLRKLPVQQRLLYEMVEAQGRVLAKDLFSKWRARCAELGFETMSLRTFKDYHLRLRQLGLLKEVRAAGRSRGFHLEVKGT